MHAAPPVIRSEVFARVPDRRRAQSCAGIGTTNAAYDGPDGEAIFITESEIGTILRARLEVAGKTMYLRK